jgi:hypothetical protein
VTGTQLQRLGEASERPRRLLTAVVGFLLALLGLTLGAGPAAAQNAVGTQPQFSILTVGPNGSAARDSVGVRGSPLHQLVSATGVATESGGVDVAAGRFAQTSYSETFSKGGLFGGRTINDVAGDLSSGVLSPKDVPINVVVRDGNTLITNTRSAQALTRAGIPRGSWNVVDQTGNPLYENLLTGQLGRNGLTSSGFEFPP